MHCVQTSEAFFFLSSGVSFTMKRIHVCQGKIRFQVKPGAPLSPMSPLSAVNI